MSRLRASIAAFALMFGALLAFLGRRDRRSEPVDSPEGHDDLPGEVEPVKPEPAEPEPAEPEIAPLGVLTPRPATPFGESVELVRKRSREIDEPIAVDEIAKEVQRKIGAETDNWFGYKSFDRFLEASLPNAQIDSDSNGSLRPDRDERDDGIVPAIRFLRANVEGFPRAGIDSWRPMYLALEQSVLKVQWSREIHQKEVFAWTKFARDSTPAGRSSDIRRKWLNFVALTLYKKRMISKGLDHTAIENGFIDYSLREMAKSGLPRIELDRGEAWLRSYEDKHYRRAKSI